MLHPDRRCGNVGWNSFVYEENQESYETQNSGGRVNCAKHSKNDKSIVKGLFNLISPREKCV